MLYAVLGAVAQFERNVLRESTVTGMRAAKKRGEHIGRPSALSPVRKGEMEEIDVPEVDPAFVTIIDAFATNRRVNRGRMMSPDCLKVNGKILPCSVTVSSS
ncbi:MAG: recombinase family protein [Candidatus Eremiobacteraeota bacterium]|nr:recombinase family protein [Candidatus Eremiobacteraeota bacterium]MBC5801466.1 recombinase family protein [Candidatus Eremiobacteraeota bacterium]MBC5820814.1 recombinase family protein [Candidatus Eremiobacteraeota bacterium]